jgi:prepilin-type N-terminal cleavage/methylation domain-containing protein
MVLISPACKTANNSIHFCPFFQVDRNGASGNRDLFQRPLRHQGFTLVELAIVLVIVAFLTGGLLMGITAQRASAENTDAQHQLDNIREALLGYAMAKGRLPCPADPASNAGIEDRPNENSQCNRIDITRNGIFGVIPWATLGLPETDPWGRRFTYYVNADFTKPITGAPSSFDLKTAGNADIKNTVTPPATSITIASNLPAVVVSHGSNGIGTSGDEQENANSTLTFVSRTPGNDFDDLVTWIAPGILMAKMVAAGRLP